MTINGDDWKRGAAIEASISSLLKQLDPDPFREGLRETPKRVAKAWAEWCGGYDTDIPSLLKTFEDGASGYDELVIVHHIPISSHCEHHMAPIVGTAHVGYLPGARIVGLSKLPRLVDAFSRRLQVQERLTVQIADTLMEHLGARAVGVIVRAEHGCMSSRGVRVHGSTTTTSAMRGLLADDRALKTEFLSLCQMADK
jgi:GTP cyclohydrolase I